MLRNTIPFLVVLFVVGLATLAWWRNSMPPFHFWSERTNRRILKAGCLFGMGGLLTLPFAKDIPSAAGVGVALVVMLWIVDCVLRKSED